MGGDADCLKEFYYSLEEEVDCLVFEAFDISVEEVDIQEVKDLVFFAENVNVVVKGILRQGKLCVFEVPNDILEG